MRSNVSGFEHRHLDVDDVWMRSLGAAQDQRYRSIGGMHEVQPGLFGQLRGHAGCSYATHMERDVAVKDLIRGITCFRSVPESASRLWSRWQDDDCPVISSCARGLLANLEPADNSPHIYSARADEKQIDLFATLDQFGFLVASRQIANSALRRAPTGTVLLDLGTGPGGQLRGLLEGAHPISKVIAVDLDGSSLDAAHAIAAERDVELVPITSSFDDLQWTKIDSLIGDRPLAVNAAFALHHLDLAAKRRMLAQIALRAPYVFTLTEPSSEHGPGSLLSRFLHVYVHFSGVLRILRANTREPSEVAALARFVTREIADILRDSPDRHERHEAWLDWYALLTEAGLEPFTSDVPRTTAPGFRTTFRLPGATDLWFEDFHQLTIFTFTAP